MLKDIDLNTAELNEKVKRFKKYKKNLEIFMTGF